MAMASILIGKGGILQAEEAWSPGTGSPGRPSWQCESPRPVTPAGVSWMIGNKRGVSASTAIAASHQLVENIHVFSSWGDGARWT